MKSARRAVVAAVFSGLALALAAPAIAAQKTVIKLGWVTPDSKDDPYAIGAHAFKDAVEKAANGRIEVELFPNRQLGDEKQLLEGIRFGTVDAGVIVNSVVSQLEPAYSVNDLPFLFASEAQAYKVLDGKVGHALAKKLEAKGVVELAFMEGGFRSMVNNVRPVNTPGDVEGVKYRVMQNPIYIAMFSSLGGSAIPMAWGETFTAMQQGTIDGLEMPVALVSAAKYYEVAKYLSLTNHTYSVANLLISKRVLEKMPKDLQAIVRAAGKSATQVQRDTHRALAKTIAASLVEKGMKVNTVADVRPFRKAVAPVYAKARDTVGPELMDAVLEAVK